MSHLLPRLYLLVLIGLHSIFSQAGEPSRNPGAQLPENRIALVIGNSNYPDAPLKNPANDARDMAAALRRLGFEVISKIDATQKEMNRAIAQFGEKLRADSVALFYYAGHGMQVKGKNYLIPIDAHIAAEASVRAETVDVDTVIDQLSSSALNIVILDACRNNPFERRFRSVGGGLAQMDAPKGSIIAYATAPGKVASDGDGRNGLYTQELLKHMQTTGLPLESVFKLVRNGVMQHSGENQTPWESSSLTGDFYFLPGPTGLAAMPLAAAAPDSAGAIELAFWDSIRSSADAEDFKAYLDKYPNGQFVSLAERRIKRLHEPTPSIDATGGAGSAKANEPARAPQDIAGVWLWSVSSIFVPDRTNTVKSDGTCLLNTGTSCVWTTDAVAGSRKIAFHFSDTWTHTMMLSEDGRTLKGTDNWGTTVIGTRVGSK